MMMSRIKATGTVPRSMYYIVVPVYMASTVRLHTRPAPPPPTTVVQTSDSRYRYSTAVRSYINDDESTVSVIGQRMMFHSPAVVTLRGWGPAAESQYFRQESPTSGSGMDKNAATGMGTTLRPPTRKKGGPAESVSVSDTSS